MTKTVYGIFFIDSNNEKQLLNSTAEITPITKYPFYVNRENAEKKARYLPQIARNKKTLLRNMLERLYNQDHYQQDYANKIMKDIEDKELIISNGVEICEIEINVNF